MTNEITAANLEKVNKPRFPRNAYRGELRTSTGSRVANIYVVNHRVFIADPREYGDGEIDLMVPGSFDPKDFERAGGYNVSATRRVDFWRFKTAQVS